MISQSVILAVATNCLMSESGINSPAGAVVQERRRQLFISYSHKDRGFLERLLIHLKPLDLLYGLETWDDSKIRPGDIWLEEIETALKSARVALLLVSPDFLVSEFIQRKELPTLFDSAQQNGLKILWIPLSPCSWRQYPQIEQYQAAVSVKKTLAEMGKVERDRVMAGLCDHIKTLFAGTCKSHEDLSGDMENLNSPLHPVSKAIKDFKNEDLTDKTLLTDSNQESSVVFKSAGADETRIEAIHSELLQQQIQMPVLGGIRHTLTQFNVTRGWLTRETGRWTKEEDRITVTGYREEISDVIGISMVKIPGGEFFLDVPVEGRLERRRLRMRGYFFGQTSITQAQWAIVAGWKKVNVDLYEYPSRFKGPNRPVEQLTWEQAKEFCCRLSLYTGRHYSLPNEVQWEYACRAGTTSPFAFGETLTSELANYDGSINYESGPIGACLNKTTDVASYPANSWGLCDMHGNIWEWCHRVHDKVFGCKQQHLNEFMLEYGKADGIRRGGSWHDVPEDCRSDSRFLNRRGHRNFDTGLRVCCLPQDLLSFDLEDLTGLPT